MKTGTVFAFPFVASSLCPFVAFPMLLHFLAFFLPLLVTIDPFGMLPVFLGVTEGMKPDRRRRVALQAVVAALLICLAFMFGGDALFKFLGITQTHFKIAGGIILLVLSVLDILRPGKPAVIEQEMAGIVPLATPLIAGPAALTTTLILAKQPAGYVWTMLSLLVNFLILLVALIASTAVARVVGLNALRAFSKIVMVLLAAIAVSYILTGIAEAFPGH